MNEQIKKAEGYYQLRKKLKLCVLGDYGTTVSDTETLERYYRSQDTLSNLFNKIMGWK
jgi:hypothetical protein